ncbi:flagellin domain protein [Candidatus Desulforudis audaxviator MP104C]|uniref:Flagellin n=2 Tax=Candidatus Desulforudis TaxID=471826 RepID=B1I5G9_DESAP|nr:flagellin domain protein [Candidatus Desulforudis audaxviator MP104C]AZK60324.1 Flagellin protein FlaB [Candidatus Desulforudis audaxviator]
MMRVQTNIAALNTHRNLGVNQMMAGRALEKLSSGFRINRAADDAAGLAISEQMRGQIRGLGQAVRNAQDGISMVQTAEGALQEIHTILQRMRELAVQAANDTLAASDRAQIQGEVDQLVSEVNRISNNTEFNARILLDGSLSAATTLQATRLEGPVLWRAAVGGLATGATVLTALHDTAGNPLGIATGDVITFEAVVNGVHKTGSFTVPAAASGMELQDLTARMNATGWITGATVSAGKITFQGQNQGEVHHIAGFTMRVVDSAGNEKTTASRYLNQFVITQVAQNASADDAARLMVGANEGQLMTVSIAKTNATTLAIQGIRVDTQPQANIAVKVIDEALGTVSTNRARLGAVQNRLEHTIANLGATAENLTAAESRIRDADMAAEMMEFTKFNILSQASIAMLAQANLQPQAVLQLLA